MAPLKANGISGPKNRPSFFWPEAPSVASVSTLKIDTEQKKYLPPRTLERIKQEDFKGDFGPSMTNWFGITLEVQD